MPAMMTAATNTAPTTTTAIASAAWSVLVTSTQATHKTTMATIIDTHRANTGDVAADTNDSPPLINNEIIQIFFCILYITVFALGVFGNVLVCYIVLRNRSMQTVTNLFITNLALSDILLCGLAVPFTPLYTFMGRWAFGNVLCHLVSFAQGCSIYISTLTLTSIAVDRYFVILYPFQPRMLLETCFGIIISIWVISILATLPYGMYMKVVTDDSLNMTESFAAASANDSSLVLNNTSGDAAGGAYDISPAITAASAAEAYMQVMQASVTAPPEATTGSQTIYCEENWPSEQYRKVFGSVTTICQFVLPFTIIAFCYTRVSSRLEERAKIKSGSSASSQREQENLRRKVRTNRMLISMVAVFGLSWLPLNLVNIFDDFYDKSNEWSFYTFIFFVAHSIAMSSTCYNPFLYAWLNDNFRKEFTRVLPFFSPSPSNNNTRGGYNRSDRNTCGPRLHHGNGAGPGGSLDADDNDENGITQETTIPKQKLLIIPREPTYGNGSRAVSPTPQVHKDSVNVNIMLNDTSAKRQRRITDDDVDSCDEQTVEMRFSETPFISSDNTTTISILDSSTCTDDGRRPN